LGARSLDKNRAAARGNEGRDRAPGRHRNAERGLLALDAPHARKRNEPKAHPPGRLLEGSPGALVAPLRSGRSDPRPRACGDDRGSSGGPRMRSAGMTSHDPAPRPPWRDVEADLVRFIAETRWETPAPAPHAAADPFSDLALRSFRVQCETIPAYGTYARHLGRGPDEVHDWREIPPVPASAFKEHGLSAAPGGSSDHVPPAPPGAVFETSGTTITRPGRVLLTSTRLYEAAPAGSRAMDTGGAKGTRVELRRDDIAASFLRVLGIPRTHLVNEYGMAELGSQFYEDTLLSSHERRAARPGFGMPPWVRTRVLDPESMREVPEGRPGLLVHYD